MKDVWGFLRGSRIPLPLAALALAGAMGLTGCLQDERVAGGDDIPNSVEPMGRRTAEATRDSSEWNAHGEAPSSAPGAYDSARVPESAPQQGAPKSSSAQKTQLLSLDAEIGFEFLGTERIVSLITEPVTGLLRAVRVQSLPALGGQAAFRAEDTTWYRADSAGPRLVRVSGSVRWMGDVRYSVFEDGDGDGLLSPRAAGSTAIARFVTVRASGERETRAMTLRAGDDRNFNDRSDNGLAALRRTVVNGLDTLLSVILTDADGDGLIYSPLRDSNQVDVLRRSRSGATQTSLLYRVALFRDSSRNYPHRYRRVVVDAAGVDSVFALGPDSLPDFAPGDSGFTRRVFRPSSASDTLVSSEAWYSVRLSEPRAGRAGARLLETNRKQFFRFGPVTQFTYRLRPAQPVADGSHARTGAVRARAELTAGGWLEFDGEASATEIFGILNDSRGREGAVRFDLNGKVKALNGF